MSGPTNQELFALLRAWVESNLPGDSPDDVTLRTVRGKTIVLPVPPGGTGPLTSGVADDWEPGDFQVEILDALEFRALHTDDLAAALECDRRKLFKRGGIKELKDRALVKTDSKVGYYRPDMPPDGFTPAGPDPLSRPRR